MAFLDYLGKKIYYEVHGQGKPILLLNGIMMSTGSWSYFKDSLSSGNKLILIDFLDQGKSDKIEKQYTQDIQVEVILSLLNELDIEKINMVGISYGGEVALQFALKYGERLDRLALFNTTARTSPWLRDIGRAWNLSKEDPLNYYLTTIPVIYSPDFYTKNESWMNKRKEQLTQGVFNQKEFMDSMERLTISAEGYDVKDRLGEIKNKTLVVGSENDYITPVNEQKILHEGIENSEFILLPDTGHGSMYEKPLLFAVLILGFINIEQTEFSIL